MCVLQNEKDLEAFLTMNINDIHVTTHLFPCFFALNICHPTVIYAQLMNLDR